MATKTETRPVTAFDRVELRYYGRLVINQSEEEALTIEADEEVLSKLRTEVRGGTLYLELGGDWLERLKQGILALGRKPITYHLTVRELRGIKVSGQGDVTASELETERLELSSSGLGSVKITQLTADTLSVNISGRGNFSLAGRVREQTVFVSGSGDYHAKELSSQRAGVRISGHGNVTLNVSHALDVTVSGYGQVDYYGDPTVSQTISGGGRVRQATL